MVVLPEPDGPVMKMTLACGSGITHCGTILINRFSSNPSQNISAVCMTRFEGSTAVATEYSSEI